VVILLAPPAWPQSGSISGIVADAESKNPIAGVRLSLCDRRGDKSVSLCSTTLTGTDGRFVFGRVSKGKYYLSGEAEGYLKDVAVLDGSGEAEFSIQAGEQRSVRFSLLRDASISGRLLDEQGHPMPGIEVTAISETSLLGRQPPSKSRIPPLGDAATDKNGEFHINSLTPDKYFLRADFSLNKVEEFLLRHGYLPAYYPDASTIKGAQVLCLASGSQQAITFVVHPRKLYEVSGKLGLPPGFNRTFEPLYGLRDESGEFLRHWQSNYDQARKSFSLSHIPPGSFELEIASGIYRGDLKASTRFSVVEANVDGLDLRMQVPSNLRARVHLPNGLQPKTPYSSLFRLVPDGTGAIEEYGTPISNDGSVTFTDLLPGHYTLYLFTDDPIYLKTAQFQGQDVITNGLLLGDSTTGDLEIAVERATGEITGKVFSSGHVPLPAADVKLITRKANAHRVVKSITTNANGEFHVTGVPPGRYELFAFDEVIRDSEVGWIDLEKLTNEPLLLEVAESSKATVELEASHLRYAEIRCDTPH